MKFLLLIFRNVRRNLVRTTLTSLGTMMLVFVLTLVWSVLSFLSLVTEEKQKNLKAIVTERWQIPSQMPFSYAATLAEGAPREEGDIRVPPEDSMTWSFYGGTTDPQNRTTSNSMFAFAMEPRKLQTMMDDLDELEGEQAQALEEAVTRMEQNRQGVILGKDRLEALNKRVGDRFKLYGINYKDIDFELEIVGQFPEGRYDSSAVINIDYLNNALDVYPDSHGGAKHPLADKSLNLVWIRVPDPEAFAKVADQITMSPLYSSPAVKCETASSGIASFLDAYRDLIWGMRWMLTPAALVSLSLIISNAISISVRERRMELAVLKVLGFRPAQILVLVLGEALLVGAGSGMISAVATYLVVNMQGGLKFPIAFFPSFMIPIDALWWGPVVGGLAAFLGTISPAWSACTVKVTDVFSKVA